MNEQFRYIVSRLSDLYTPAQARELAFIVLEETLDIHRTQLICGCKDTQNIPNLEIILQKLLHHEPVEYIFGHTIWAGLDLRLNTATLIPRPETAELVTLTSSLFPSHQPIHCFDIGTGSGCIAIALKRACPAWHIVGIDISDEALTIAQSNASTNGVDVTFRQLDILTQSIPPCDIIVSNPPYVRESEKSTILPNVLNYEPAIALFVPDDDALLFYRRIASLKAASCIVFEINEALSPQVLDLLQSLHYTPQLHHDQFGKPRFVTAYLKPNTK